MPITDGNLPSDASQFRAVGVYSPNTGVVALQGGATSTDGQSPPQPYAPGIFRLEDGQTTLLVNVVAFHNGDNQSLSSSGGSLLTSGIAQILNAVGNGDRQRETGLDQVGPQGVTMGSQMFAQAFKTTVPTTGSITAGAASATITPASMTGVVVGAVLTLDTGASVETAVVTALPTASTATIVPTNGSPSAPSFKSNHTPSYPITGFLFNQERDASGENSGAKGLGTAVAAEYEYTSGGPALANGTASQLAYDREVAALGKVAANSGAGFAITSTTAGNTSLTPTTPSQFAALVPGVWIRLTGSGTAEYVRVDESYTISATPASIPLTSPVVNTGQTTAIYDVFGANGPGQNPVLWSGEGFEGLLLNDLTQPGFARLWQGDPLGNAKVTNYGGTKATYTYAISATAPYATPTDWIVIRGSASKTVKIVRIEISGAATAATEVIFTINKHTVANTGGTSTTPTPMQHDSADGAATATVLNYSAAPTISGTATIWKSVRMTLAVAPAATTVAPDRYVYTYTAEPYEPLTLRGVAQECAINFAGAAVPSGGVYDVAITFTEE